MNTSFFGELLQTISERGRALLARDRRGDASARSENLVELCEHLLSGRGEASGVALAREILNLYGTLTIGPRIAFFEALAQRFGIDTARMDQAVDAWRASPSDATAAQLDTLPGVLAATAGEDYELLRVPAAGGARPRWRDGALTVVGRVAAVAPDAAPGLRLAGAGRGAAAARSRAPRRVTVGTPARRAAARRSSASATSCASTT